jgi:Tol biopolymer transport system component
MLLRPGQQVLHYHIDEPIGEGGMGVVWKARDSRLGRDVAVKVLPAEVAGDPDRLARFDREARTLAALHHPHVASIFGFEEADGVRFLVMELVGGEDLARRVERGPVATTEALEVARQIAEGLEAAHERGIVHRDLKPANVKIAPDGTVKVLDFGLAKAWRGDDAVSGSGDLSQSPTLARTGTAAGLILGTAAYMAPEQARGRPVDRRGDIWSFGVVLFEMLAGQPLFRGETVSDVLASVLKTEVDFGSLPDDTPAPVRRLLRRCLERDPRRRLRDIGDARLEIEAALAGDEAAVPTDGAAAAAPRSSRRIPWIIAGVALAALAWTLWLAPGTGGAGRTPYELSVPPPPEGQWLTGANLGWGVLSPDGRSIVARAVTPEGSGLWVQPLDGTGGRLLPRTEDGFYPFWSPDGRWVAFFNRGLLQRVEVDGGLPERICVAPWGRGGSWSAAGRILLTPVGGGSVHVVDAEGGEPRPVTRVDTGAGEDAHYWPVWLPDGERFLYFIRSGRREDQGIYLGRVLEDGPDDARVRVVASASSGLLAASVPDGPSMLLWVQDGTLLARAFDLREATVSGVTARVAEGVRVIESQLGAMFSASRDGTIVWASTRFGRQQLTWYDREGRRTGSLPAPAGASLHEPRSSPDGRWASYVVVEGGQGDVWVLDTETGTTRALTSSAQYEENVVWSPDSTEIIIQQGGQDDKVHFRLHADGSDLPRPILEGTVDGRPINSPEGWLPGDWLVVTVNSPDGTDDVLAVSLDDPAEAVELAAGPGDQYGSAVAPGGTALAYTSDESGRLEAYVVSLSRPDGRPTPGSDRQRVTLEDVLFLEWNLAGDTLFAFTSRGELVAIRVASRDGRLQLGTPSRLFALPADPNATSFAIAPGGDRFLFVDDPDAEHQAFGVLLDWSARLDR